MGRRAGGERVLFHAGDFPALEAALWRELEDVRGREALAPVVVLAPTNLLRQHLRTGAARRGGCLNVHFMTLLDLARELGEPALALAGRALAPRFGAELLARAVCREVSDTYYAAIAERPGFHSALVATVTDFKEGGHGPGDLVACVAQPGLRDGPAGAKLRDLARLWAALEERLDRLGLCDVADLMSAAAEAAPCDPWLAQAAAVFVYGFYDFNELQRRLVAGATGGWRAAAFVPYVPDAPAFRYAEPTFKWLKSLGFQPRAVPAACGLSAELVALRDNLFEAPRHVGGKGSLAGARPERVRILSAPDDWREVRAVVRAALLDREAANRKSEIGNRESEMPAPSPRVGILMRQSARYAPLFAEECGAGGLEAYHHDPAPLSATRAGRSFLLLVNLFGSEFPRADVMEFLTYADLPVAGAPTADWELATIRAGIVKGRDAWFERLRALRDALRKPWEWDDGEDSPERRAELGQGAETLEAFLSEFFAALAAVPPQGTWRQLVEAALTLFRRFVRPSAEREAVAETVGALASLDAAGEPADTALLARFAREALEGSRPGGPPLGSRKVAIVDLLEGRGLPFGFVCLPGMVEGGFPAPAAQDPLLSDRERAELNEAGLRLPLKSRRGEEERLLFRLAAGAASERLLLTYPRLEQGSGRERVPSHYLLRVVEALTGSRCDYEGLRHFAGHECVGASAFAPAQPKAAWREAEYDLAAAQAALREGRGVELAYLAAISPSFAAALNAEAARWGEARFTPYDGVLSDPAALAAIERALGPPPWRMRPTALEGYAACPFRYFLERVLRVRPLEQPEEVRRLSSLDKGKLLHGILRRFMERAKSQQLLPISEAAEGEMIQMAREEFDHFEKLGLVGLATLWSLERDAMEADLRRFVRREAADSSGYIPARFEVSFGTRPGAEPAKGGRVVFALGELGEVEIAGRIDRIDLTADGRRGRVVDYKSGKKKERDDRLEGGTALQLPLYIRAAETLLAGTEIAEAVYRFVTAREHYSEVSFSREAYVEREQDLMQVLRTIVEGIRLGRFFAGALAGKGCGERCDYRQVCGSAAGLLAERKATDPAAAAYRQMREVE